MASENFNQSLNNKDWELTWEVKDGVHTIKLIESVDPELTNPPTMVRPQTTKKTFTYTEE